MATFIICKTKLSYIAKRTMKHLDRFALVLIVLFSYFGQSRTADSICGADWLPYKDEKCFRVIDDTLRKFDDAEKACAKLENYPTLPIIRSKDEQDFLSDYLFKILKKEDSFWIGAKFSVNASHFKWLDNSDLTYANWDSKGTDNQENQCVQIQADHRVLGKWIDEPCGKSNKVVCQKLQTWSMAQLQKEFLDERKQHRDALESANNNFKHELEIATSYFKQQLDEANKKIVNLQQLSSVQNVAELKQSLIPIGFLYTQLPKEKGPTEIWPWMKWEDASSAYAGVFFRVDGGGAATFGQVQNENSPHLIEMVNHFTTARIDYVYTTVGGWSGAVTTGSWTNNGSNVLVDFLLSGGEVRPRNMAIRVWRRIG